MSARSSSRSLSTRALLLLLLIWGSPVRSYLSHESHMHPASDGADGEIPTEITDTFFFWVSSPASPAPDLVSLWVLIFPPWWFILVDMFNPCETEQSDRWGSITVCVCMQGQTCGGRKRCTFMQYGRNGSQCLAYVLSLNEKKKMFAFDFTSELFDIHSSGIQHGDDREKKQTPQ